MRKTLTLTIAVVTVLLAGCSDFTKTLTDTSYRDYYRLDGKSLSLCRGQTVDCYPFSSLSSAQERLPAIEKAYDYKFTGPNYPLEAARLILRPPHQEYTIERGPNGRYFKLPINEQTRTVWNALEQAGKTLYFETE